MAKESSPAKLIQARLLKGFRDSLPYGPQGEKRRQRVIGCLGRIFELAGFEPIDTPALELCEILLGKAGGETEKQIYRFQDNGGREVALRFDLTVPFARFVVQHAGQLHFPFKRYHIAKVWRGENAQRGRYREFFQCDFDIVGDSSVLADLCVLQTVHNALSRLQCDYPALGPLCIRVNHRGLLNAFWQLCGVVEEQRVLALRIIDKWDKIGSEAAGRELEAILGPDTTETLLRYLGMTQAQQQFGDEGQGSETAGSSIEVFFAELQRLQQLLEQLAERSEQTKQGPPGGGQGVLPAEARQALSELHQIAQFAAHSGIRLHFSPGIARGLDYYTGMVFESFLEKLPGLGSVCSGGRYDQLTRLYSKTRLPGVGGSIGLDRLLAGLEELEKQTELEMQAAGSSQGGSAVYNERYVILSSDPGWKLSQTEQEQEQQVRLACLQMSQELQAAQWACDLVPPAKKMNVLFQRAEVKGCRYLLLLCPDGHWQLRDLQTRQSRTISTAAQLCELLEQAWPGSSGK